jgi:hypothetical protein
MDAKRQGGRSVCKSHRASQHAATRTARRGACRRVDCENDCRVVAVGAEAEGDCRGVDTAATHAAFLKYVMKAAWSAYYAANKADPRNPLDVAGVAHTARVSASALIAIAASIESPGGTGADGSTGGITEGHTPDA